MIHCLDWRESGTGKSSGLLTKVSLAKPTIYALVDPRDGCIRYVGQSVNLVQRYKAHLKERGTGHKVRWMQALKAEAMLPQLAILEQCDDAIDLRPLEIFYIALHKPDLNVDDGTGVRSGMGPVTSRATVEWRAKIAASQVGKPSKFRGKRHSEATKQRMSEFMREHNRLHPRRLSPAHIEAMRLGRERARNVRTARLARDN